MKTRVLFLLLVLVGCQKTIEKPSLLKSDVLALSILYSHIPKWEGSTITNHPNDRGGLTNSGITYNTYLHVKDKIGLPEFKNITEKDVQRTIRWFYHTYGCSKINNAKISALLTEFYWGGNSVIKDVANFYGLGLKDRTTGYALSTGFIRYVNSLDTLQQEVFIEMCLNIRESYFNSTVKKLPSQQVFLQGWLNRNNDLRETLSKITYHLVSEDNTLYNLSKQYNIPLNNLRFINSIDNDIIKLNSIIYVLERSANTNVNTQS